MSGRNLGFITYLSARAWARVLASMTPRHVYVVNLRGLDSDAVQAHLRRCCGPALCCSELIADQLGDAP